MGELGLKSILILVHVGQISGQQKKTQDVFNLFVDNTNHIDEIVLELILPMHGG
jgi:hypothetical protein